MHLEPEKHLFAIYFPLLTNTVSDSSNRQLLIINDPAVCHRLQHVLRLDIHDRCILFDREKNVTIEITELTKKYIGILIVEIQKNKQLTPAIFCMLPLLKREALETAVDALTQLGATTIQLLITQKVQRSWQGPKELERLQRIIIAAAEQSKNFAFPQLNPPILLNDFLNTYTTDKTSSIFFDAQGTDAFSLISNLKSITLNTVSLMIGPEGDLTQQEKQLLKEDHGFNRIALTPTILRAEQALSLGVGMIRTLI